MSKYTLIDSCAVVDMANSSIACDRNRSSL